SNQSATYNPQKIRVRVRNGGVPVSGCEVAWQNAVGHGWVFPDALKTDANGEVSAYWTAGNVASETTKAFIALAGGGTSSVNLTGSAAASPETRTDSVWLRYDVPGAYSEFKVQVTPVTAPATTYYSTINWDGAYGGIQFDGASTLVLFSVWDVTATQKAEFV